MSLVESLLSCLSRENTLIIEFSATLNTDTEALGDRKASHSLQAIAEHKASLANQLAECSKERDDLLSALGFASGHQGTEDAVAQHPVLAALWEELLHNAAEASAINARNGALIELSLQYTQQSLDALRKLDGATGAGTYDAQGRGSRPGAGIKPIIAR